MVTVPLRAVPVLVDTPYCTAPLPVPDAPDVIVMNAALLVAVQEQPAVVVTATVPELPDAATLFDVGLIE